LLRWFGRCQIEYLRSFSYAGQFRAMAFAQLTFRESLREIL
jgi:hypothetical protein